MNAGEYGGLAHPREIETSALYRAYFFGSPRIFRGDDELRLENSRKKCVHILLFFLLNPHRPFSSDELVEALWPDVEPSRAIGRFDVTMHALKRVLQPELRPHESSLFVRHHANRVYSFAAADLWWSDAADLELSCRRGYNFDIAGDHLRARFYYRRLFAHISRGPLLHNETEGWLESHRRRYSLMCSQALMRLLRLDMSHSVDEELIETASYLLAVDPANLHAASLLRNGPPRRQRVGLNSWRPLCADPAAHA